MSFIDTLKKLIGIKKDEVIPEVAEEKAAEEVIPMVEEKVEDIAPVVEEKVCDADCDCHTEEDAPKTDDSIMGDNQ